MGVDQITFDSFVLGVAAWVETNQTYPYPALFQQGCHQLALHMMQGVGYPRTKQGLFALLERPVGEWWPLTVPAPFDGTRGLLYDGRLSEEAAEYVYNVLDDEGSIALTGPAALQVQALENRIFRSILQRLRAMPEHERAQHEYVALRRFLIEQPYSTTSELRAAFGRMRLIGLEEIGQLYRTYPAEQPVWLCVHCGPLSEQGGRLRGIKPEICNDHRRDRPWVREIAAHPQRRCITEGIHRRVCQPGIAELELLRELEALQATHGDRLIEVELWPGLDRYDLRLRFSDGMMWAVDVKDYSNPAILAPHLRRLPNGGALRHDASFYVIPAARVRAVPGYLTIAHQGALELPPETVVLTDTEFLARVRAVLTGHSQGGMGHEQTARV
jgi:hypothetical protein